MNDKVDNLRKALIFYLPNSASISFICSGVNGPNSIALAFSSTCASVLKPGMGIVFSLRAQIQASAPWTSVRPLLVRISRIESNNAVIFYIDARHAVTGSRHQEGMVETQLQPSGFDIAIPVQPA